MRRKNGFTLIELLAIITILAIVAITTFPAVSSAINRSKERAYETQVKLVEDAAGGYVSEHVKELFPNNEEVAYVSLTDLKANKVVQNKKVTDPKTGKPMNGCVKVSKDSYGQYKVKYYEKSCEELGASKTYRVGDSVYFDPTGTVTNCTAGNEWTPSKTGTTCYKWNIIKINGDKFDILLDHNTTNVVDWNSSGMNSNGPVKALSQLKSDTTTWVKAETLTASDNVKLTGNKSEYTINYTDMKARFISGLEIATISLNNSWTSIGLDIQIGASYNWLYQNTTSSTIGYWTDTARNTEETGVWYQANGKLSLADADSLGIGVRPVVRISKLVL